MGWVSLPPNFSATTETVANLANTALSNPGAVVAVRCAPHCFDVLSKSNPESDTLRPAINDLKRQQQFSLPPIWIQFGTQLQLQAKF